MPSCRAGECSLSFSLVVEIKFVLIQTRKHTNEACRDGMDEAPDGRSALASKHDGRTGAMIGPD